MQLQFNDEKIETLASNLEELLDEMSLSTKTGIAVAVNDFVVQRPLWKTQLLNEQDVVLVITAAAGG